MHHASRRFPRESGVLRADLTAESGAEEEADGEDGGHEEHGGWVCESEHEEGFGVAGEEHCLRVRLRSTSWITSSR